MLFAELNLEGILRADDSAFGPETTRGEIPESLFWSTFCQILERIEPQREDGAQNGQGAQGIQSTQKETVKSA